MSKITPAEFEKYSNLIWGNFKEVFASSRYK
ncbi:MAG: hypothetical protein MRERC_1c208 [Mycoplasmataceae bacterium RC_NB112A]|nr:MAG: hypothetical protein MRERC_1c208 [Mycoplasmataceae bacterium RC_NB112A]